MTVAVVAEGCIIAFLLVIHFALVNVMRGMTRQHDRRVDLLLNRLAHAEGRPWQQPPVAEPDEAESEPVLVYTAEQDPDY